MKNLLGSAFIYSLLAYLLILISIFFILKPGVTLWILLTLLFISLTAIFAALNQFTTIWIYFDSRKRGLYGEVPNTESSIDIARQLGLLDLIFYLKRRDKHPIVINQPTEREISWFYLLLVILGWFLLAGFMTYFFYIISFQK